MKNCLLFLVVVFYAFNANAQTYLISFAGTGASGTVSTVKVENLTTGTTLTLNGNDILQLTTTTDIHSIDDGQSSELKIYPNPMIDNSLLQFNNPDAGNVIIGVIDMNGKLLTQIQSNLDKGLQEFHISGLMSGSYLISIVGSTYRYSGKLLCNSKGSGLISIEKINNNQVVYVDKTKTESKGSLAAIDMAYNPGDRLKFTAVSGTYSTVITDLPTQNETISFDFVPCTDADNNNYPVVKIGTQLWMAKNLAYLPSVSPSSEGLETSPYYYVYGYQGTDVNTAKETGNYNTYGVLYNWNAAQNACPTGWHLPNDTEWHDLALTLDANSTLEIGTGTESNIAGGKLKEIGTAHWSSPNTGATNEYGFTAFAGGNRDSGGTFDLIGISGLWWGSTEQSPYYPWYRGLTCSGPRLERAGSYKTDAFSVRCLKN